jgi:hypothetical protein
MPRQPSGAQALLGALQNDHSTGLEHRRACWARCSAGRQGARTNGAGILGHIFGDNQQRAAEAWVQATGLGNDKAAMLLQILARS